jgi:hypothetical protein
MKDGYNLKGKHPLFFQGIKEAALFEDSPLISRGTNEKLNAAYSMIVKMHPQDFRDIYQRTSLEQKLLEDMKSGYFDYDNYMDDELEDDCEDDFDDEDEWDYTEM